MPRRTDRTPRNLAMRAVVTSVVVLAAVPFYLSLESS